MSEIEYAIRIARLWKAGKLIGGDEDEVLQGVLAGYDAAQERIRALETALWTYGHHISSGPNGCMVDFAADGDQHKCICGLTGIRGSAPETDSQP